MSNLVYDSKAMQVQQEFVDAYLEWLNDDSYVDGYSYYQPFGSDVLVRIFRFEPDVGPGDSFYIDFAGKDKLSTALYARTIPVARVIQIGPDCNLDIKVGDLVTVPDTIAMTVRNPAYDIWMEEASNSRPKPKGSAPAEYMDALVRWSDKIFVRDKVVGMQKEDLFTFLLPQGYLRSKIRSDEEIQRVSTMEVETVEVEVKPPARKKKTVKSKSAE